jgi:hypothetical protein
MRADETIMLPVYRKVQILPYDNCHEIHSFGQVAAGHTLPASCSQSRNGQQAKGGHDDCPARSREIEIRGSVRQ